MSTLIRNRGFTLLEVLVAIVVVATGLLAVSSAAGNSSRRAVQLRDDTFAQWVGLNELTMGYIETARPVHVGLVWADFPGRGLIDAIIRVNRPDTPD